MGKEPISEQSIQSLCKTMGKSISESFPDLYNCVKTFKAINQIDSNQVNDESTKKRLMLWKSLLDLELIVLYTNTEIATSLRTNFRSILPNEKRYNLKFINVTTLEGYKYLLGFGKAKNKSVWHKIKELANQSDDQDFKDECISIEKELKHFGDEETNKELRDIAEHFDKSPIQVYNNLIELSEEREALRAIAFMAILQSISNFISKFIQKYQIPLYVPSPPSDEVLIWENINHFEDKEDYLYEKLGIAVQKFSKTLEYFIKLHNIPDKMKERFNLDETSIYQLNHLLKSFQPSIHIAYLYLDLACAIRAYLKSEYYIEKQLNLRHINVIVHAGFKLLYGYKEEEHSDSFWSRDISYIIARSTDTESNAILNSIEERLKELSQDTTINNPHLRNISVHFRDKDTNNIPLIFNELIKLNPIIEMSKSLKILNILPALLEAMQSAMHIVQKEIEVQQQQSLNETTMRIDSLITTIQSRKTKDSQKDGLIKMLKQIKSFSDKIEEDKLSELQDRNKSS